MKVSVRYLAQLKQAAGLAVEQIDLETGGTVADLMVRLAERHGPPLRSLLLDGSGRPTATILVFLGDEQAGPEDGLGEGDSVTFLSPIAGG